MKYNPNDMLAANLKEEGLHIVDKRGIKFENEAERNMIWEGHILAQNFSEDLDADRYDLITEEEYYAAMRQFKLDMCVN